MRIPPKPVMDSREMLARLDHAEECERLAKIAGNESDNSVDHDMRHIFHMAYVRLMEDARRERNRVVRELVKMPTKDLRGLFSRFPK